MKVDNTKYKIMLCLVLAATMVVAARSWTPLSGQLVVGVTGGIACGKSTLCSALVGHFNGQGVQGADAPWSSSPLQANLHRAHHVDLDTLAGYEELGAEDAVIESMLRLGADVRREGGGVDRAKLGRAVFQTGAEAEERMSALEGILWPRLEPLVEKTLSDASERAAIDGAGSLVLLEGVKLQNAGWGDKFCDAVWEVSAPFEVAVARVQGRDGVDEGVAEDRVRRAKGSGTPDFVINSGTGMQDMIHQGVKEIEKLLEAAKETTR